MPCRCPSCAACDVLAGDRRRLDLVVYGATARGSRLGGHGSGATARGGALCCDARFVSPLAQEGRPPASYASRKRATYPELCRHGRTSLRPATCQASVHRWTLAAQRAYASSLLELPLVSAEQGEGDAPPLKDLLSRSPTAASPRPR